MKCKFCSCEATRVMVFYSMYIRKPMVWPSILCDSHYYSQFSAISELWGNQISEAPLEEYNDYLWEYEVQFYNRTL